jgi:glutamine amidotransferase
MKITVCSTGTSNLFNVVNAISSLGHDVFIDTDGSAITKSDVAVLPGVAAFGPVSQELIDNGQSEEIKRHVRSGKKLVGLCLGAQLLLNKSEENPGAAGLSLVDGDVKKLSLNGSPVPRQGWFKLDLINPQSYLQDFNGKYVYFSHSYSAHFLDNAIVNATSDHGSQQVVSIFQRDNCMGIQFHPERSGKIGLQLLDAALVNA